MAAVAIRRNMRPLGINTRNSLIILKEHKRQRSTTRVPPDLSLGHPLAREVRGRGLILGAVFENLALLSYTGVVKRWWRVRRFDRFLNAISLFSWSTISLGDPASRLHSTIWSSRGSPWAILRNLEIRLRALLG